MNRLVAAARLVRAPNALTTIADLVAGMAVGVAAGGHAPHASELILAGLGLALLYSFGMALNDIIDRDKDRTLHPQRVLASGTLPLQIAIGVAAASAAIGLGCLFAALMPRAGAIWATAWPLTIAAAVAIYDGPARRSAHPGAIMMGVCRALSLGTGVVLAGWSSAAAAAPIAYGTLIYALTLTSLREEAPASKGSPWLLILFGASYLVPGAIERDLAAFLGGIVLAVFVLAPARNARWGLVVRNGVFTTVLYGALWCLAVRQWNAMIICIALYPVIRVAAALLRQRGS